MRFFKRNNTDTAAIPEDLQAYYSSSDSGIRRWVGPILRGILLLIVLALLVWGAIWLINKIRNSNDAKNAANETSQNTQKAGSSAANSPAAEGDKSPAPKPAPSNGTTPTPAPSPATPAPAPAPSATPKPAPSTVTPTTPGAASSQQLVNSGPGEVIGAFLATVSAGFLAFRVYLLRHFKNS